MDVITVFGSSTLEWAGVESELARYVRSRSSQCLSAYRANPILVSEHANIERATAQGGYGRRQIYELVQNGADPLLDCGRGRIHVLLTATRLYCANEGLPLAADGVDAILNSHVSLKRGSQIGRFGLGFKSILGVSTCPRIFSRSGSFYFDADASHSQIAAIVPSADRFPVLRLAWPLDPHAAASADPVLAELMGWATTIVEVPRTPDQSSWLSDDVKGFPAEFLLFCPHVGELLLEDRTSGVFRRITVERTGEELRLAEGEQNAVWRVYSTTHTPSAAARGDAGELADRESVSVTWAVPGQGRPVRGRFWAFFPTDYFTTLSGIVNAPWKTNDDRQTVLRGAFNEELIECTARLVVESLASLSAWYEPGRIFDMLPARGREAPNWADERLTERVYAIASRERSVPDQTGELRFPAELSLHPADLPQDALEAWARHPCRGRDWCHPSVEGRDRRPRVERLLAVANRGVATVEKWLETLVVDKAVSSVVAAIDIAAKVTADAPSLRDDVCRSRIVLTAAGTLVRPSDGTVFTPPPGEAEADLPATALVHPGLLSTDAGFASIKALGIGPADAAAELRGWLRRFTQTRESDWLRFWALARQVGPGRVQELLNEYRVNPRALCVRTIAGAFRPAPVVLLPGSIVGLETGRDAEVTVDTRFHSSDNALMSWLGIVAGPTIGAAAPGDVWWGQYRRHAVECLMARLEDRASRPREDLLGFEHDRTVGPLDVVPFLSEEGRARYTVALVQAAQDEPLWRFEHTTRPDQYPVIELDPPPLWVARSQGVLQTSLGLHPVSMCVSEAFSSWASVLPVAACPTDVARRLRLPAVPSDLDTRQWSFALERLRPELDDRLIGEVYTAAAAFVPPPPNIRCRRGTGFVGIDPSLVHVAEGDVECAALRTAGEPYVVAPSPVDAQLLVQNWGLRDASAAVTIEVVAEPSGPTVGVTTQYPVLSHRLLPEHRGLSITPCSLVALRTHTAQGTTTDERSFVRQEDTMYVLESLPPEELLDAILAEMGLEVSEQERRAALDGQQLQRQRERILAVRTKKTPEDKLLAAVGVEGLRRNLPAVLLGTATELLGELNDVDLARLMLASHGPNTLKTLAEPLKARGFETPGDWAGSHPARAFVKQLGFPPEYAGFKGLRREPLVEVEGPPDLPSLHPFQAKIADRIESLVRGGVGRGLLSLPTGAGKTRIAVESLIRAVQGGFCLSPGVWIAQSEELCEQAVETWVYVWRWCGPGRRLVVNRLWGVHEADPEPDVQQVVVATIQKLRNCVGNPAYAWLSEAGCVVVDEAHGSTEPSYTSVLGWLGLGRGDDRCPLIGLTATPFRGGTDETRRLVSRYDGRRLDAGVLGDDPYAVLQDMGVLAHVDHELLEGSTLELDDRELAGLRQMRQLPPTAGQRIARDVSRNTALLKSIEARAAAGAILVFAASVEHAEVLAALLTLRGVPAAAISSQTDPGLRRHYIERFRAGTLAVLTNYAVLTEGFDAPSVRAVYVARPTYSPVLYQQMIGRGLRGPLNGGEERCAIVNVVDNIVQYGEELAFRKFEYLWERAL